MAIFKNTHDSKYFVYFFLKWATTIISFEIIGTVCQMNMYFYSSVGQFEINNNIVNNFENNNGTPFCDIPLDSTAQKLSFHGSMLPIFDRVFCSVNTFI